MGVDRQPFGFLFCSGIFGNPGQAMGARKAIRRLRPGVDNVDDIDVAFNLARALDTALETGLDTGNGSPLYSGAGANPSPPRRGPPTDEDRGCGHTSLFRLILRSRVRL